MSAIESAIEHVEVDPSTEDPTVDTARLPITAALDGDGRLVAIADLRGLGPHADCAVGRIRELGASADRRLA